ncbi:MAG: apolipoprotein N-acyltransferase [Spirochaetaceae bacterium]|jgi:apolipoprotein N-acyltransferase|nr:apolipoprotein N-acyltransferase [Spirochaetaceae bacterium]
MNPSQGLTGLKNAGIHCGALILGAVLFAGAFPNAVFPKGLPVLGWIAYAPVFWVARQASLGACFLWGAFYGYTAYSLFNFWLSAFHPVAGLVVGVVYSAYFAVLFPLLKLAVSLFPRKGYILQWLFWMSFEYLRTLGFLGYSYGIIGYSQWEVIPIIQIADTFGVWGVSALIVFPSAWLAGAFSRKNGLGTEKPFFRREWLAGFVWIGAFSAALGYGFAGQVDYAEAPVRRIALIQHNTDPWLGGMLEYRNNFEVLKRLSDEALRQDPKPDMVVWSETAFVPRIYWHIHYRGDPDSYILVKDLMDYLADQDVPFVIGNDDARKEPEKNANPAEEFRVDYNAVMLFDRGKLIDQYRKVHLVPFTEQFPYKKELPKVYAELKKRNDIHLWEKGADFTVFSAGGARFSTPICFEDTFGNISREFVRNGAELLVNVTNDAWSQSLPAQMQHLSMAVFRAVENRRAMVRATASGQTCGIDPNGRIIAMADAFTETQLTVAVPILRVKARYTEYGDFFPVLCAICAGILLIFGIISGILNLRNRRKRKNARIG